MSQQRYGLDSLPQPHFVSQDPIQVIIVERHQPLKPNNLVRFEFSPYEKSGLSGNLLFDGVGEIVIHLVGIKEAILNFFVSRCKFHVLGLIVGLPLLEQNLGSQLSKEIVCLLQQLLDFEILGFLNQFEILIHIVLLEGFQSSSGGLVF